ncbi:MAG: nitroreductase family protein [Pseudomonadota bacterium]
MDLAITDELLCTTRAVRKRLDLTRPVPDAVLQRCLEIALQAPTGSNRQGWRWLVVTDPDKRARLAEIYRRGADTYLNPALDEANAAGNRTDARVFSSAIYLAEHLHEVPVHVIPCIVDHIGESRPGTAWAGLFGSIFPAVWSFQLALRARGLGSCITTLHLRHAEEAAELLGLPDDVLQVALLPVAYTLGTDFKPARRAPLDTVVHWNTWS